MTSQEWENKHIEEDELLKKKILKFRRKSTRRLYAGTLAFVFLAASIGSAFNRAGRVLEEDPDSAAYIIQHDIFGGTFFIQVFAIIFIGGFFLARAATLWNRTEEMSEHRLIWMPCDDEKKDIETRFDNDFVHFILAEISLRNTESVKISLDGINIRNNTGDVYCNLNRSGFKRLSNYETKQLAYFIADRVFTEGFIIYQSKKYETIYSRYVGGVTDIGGENPAKHDHLRMIVKELKWLISQITSLLQIKSPLLALIEQKPSDPAMVEGGQIILNKGYRQDDSEYKTL